MDYVKLIEKLQTIPTSNPYLMEQVTNALVELQLEVAKLTKELIAECQETSRLRKLETVCKEDHKKRTADIEGW